MTTRTRTQQDYPDSSLDLEREFQVTDEDIERAYRRFVSTGKPKKKQKNKPMKTAAGVFGIAMVVVSVMMVLQLMGLDVGTDVNFTQHILLSVIGALLVLLGWSSLKRKKENGEAEVFEEPPLKVRKRSEYTAYEQTRSSRSQTGADAGERESESSFRNFRANSSGSRAPFAEKVADAAARKSARIDSFALSQKKTIYRSRTNKKIFGICGGLADYFGVDAVYMRLAFALLIFPLQGTPAFLYIILAIILKKEPKS